MQYIAGFIHSIITFHALMFSAVFLISGVTSISDGGYSGLVFLAVSFLSGYLFIFMSLNRIEIKNDSIVLSYLVGKKSFRKSEIDYIKKAHTTRSLMMTGGDTSPPGAYYVIKPKNKISAYIFLNYGGKRSNEAYEYLKQWERSGSSDEGSEATIQS